MIIGNRTIAWFGAAGTLSDAIGGLYLTYDLLGGSGGPLGLITRAATYGLVYALAYGAAFGPWFGAVAGGGLGAMLAVEFWRVAYHQRTYGSSPLYHVRLSGVARGLVLGVGSAHLFGWRFGAVFGVLNAVFLFVAYHLRFAPTLDYEAAPRLRFNRHRQIAALARALAIGVAGALTGWFVNGHAHALALGLTIGLVVGLLGVVIGVISPVIEWWVENLPERTLAAFGFSLIALGLLLQSVQYVVVILGLQ